MCCCNRNSLLAYLKVLVHSVIRTGCGEQPTFLEGVSFLDTPVLQRTFEEVKMEVT